MADIFATIPWCCGESQCTEQWHQSNYWCYDDGYSIDYYGDGNHEDCEYDDIPSHEDISQAWLDYARWVLSEGKDPLGNYFVKHTRLVRESWFAQFSNSIIGPRVLLLRRGRNQVPVSEMPQHVMDYLQVLPCKPQAAGTGVYLNLSWAELLAWDAVKQWKNRPMVASVRFAINRQVMRSPVIVARELRRAAKRHLSSPTDLAGPTYDVWIAEPDNWEWQSCGMTFTCSDDPDGDGARRSAHDHARYLRNTYPCAFVAVRAATKGLPLSIRLPLP